MFRVRKTFFGRCILQVSEHRQWVDVKPTDMLLKGFSIVSLEFADAAAVAPGTSLTSTKYLKQLLARVELYERRAAKARRARLKKRAPVLSEALIEALPKPAKLGAERVAIEQAIRTERST